MAKKEYTYRGKKFDELRDLDTKDFAKMTRARQRRSLDRGLTEMQLRLIEKIRKAKDGKYKKPVKTHCRDMVVLPEMVGVNLQIHNGKSFVAVLIQKEMIGHYLGEFAGTRNKVAHSAPGVGATKSSAAASVK